MNFRVTAMLCAESAPMLRDAAAAFAEETALDLLHKVAASDMAHRKCWIQVCQLIAHYFACLGYENMGA